MSNHSPDYDAEMTAKIKEMREDTRARGEELGATQRFPRGKATQKDEGEIRFAVANDGKIVVIDFGRKPITWVGMPPDGARDLARLLVSHAEKVEHAEAKAVMEPGKRKG